MRFVTAARRGRFQLMLTRTGLMQVSMNNG